MEKPRTYQIRASVSFGSKEEREFIQKAVDKVNKDAGNGVDLKMSAFMRNASLEKAEKELGQKRPSPT